jgi:hypothetical protein
MAGIYRALLGRQVKRKKILTAEDAEYTEGSQRTAFVELRLTGHAVPKSLFSLRHLRVLCVLGGEDVSVGR